MVAQGRMTGAPLKGTIGKTAKARLNIGLTRPAKPGQRGAYNEARTQIRASKSATKPTATALGGRLNPANKALRAADKKFLSTIQKEKNVSDAAVNARRNVKAINNRVKTPIAKGAKINNTISKTKEKRDLTGKQRLLKQRLNRVFDLPQNKPGAKGKRTAQIRAKAIATLQGTKRPDISDSTVGGLRRARTSTGYKAPSSRLPTPSRTARAQGRAQALASTAKTNSRGQRIGNPTKLDKKVLSGRRAIEFQKNPKSSLAKTLVQGVKSRGPKGTAGFVAKPRSLTQTPKPIKKATNAKGARLGGTRKTTKAAAPKNTTPNKTGQSKTLNKFNSRPAGTKIINAKNQLVGSSTRVPLKVQGKGANESDRAFARVATKSARSRAKAKPTPKPVSAAAKPTATAKNRASEMRKRAAQLDQRGNALMGGGRRDTAAVNLNLNSSARRNETNAGFKGLEMTRNAERLRSKAGRIEYRSNESRAKKLRSVHETPIAKAFAKKAGKSVTEVRAAIRSMTPEKQIKMFKQHVKETRSAAKPKRKP
jgi:hypothetical protein